MKAFISYSHADRKSGAALRDVLEDFGISAFLAHDDLNISEEWRNRILEELRSCKLFFPLLSENFLSSQWTSQEVGYIISRPEVPIIPIALDSTVPYGFMSHVQSKRAPKEGITSEFLIDPLIRKASDFVLTGLIKKAVGAGSFRGAEILMAPLVPHFPIFTKDQARAFAQGAARNPQVWSASLCRDSFLPAFIEEQGKNIDRQTLKELRYQIKNDEWFPKPTK